MANIDDKLRGSYFQQDIMRHYHNTVGQDKLVFNNVNLEGIQLATRKHEQRNQMLKCLHNQWPTNERNHKWNISDTNIYQMCTTEIETWQHVLQCCSIHVTRYCVQSISNVRKELQNLKTCPDIVEHVIHVINSWSKNEKPTPPQIEFKPYRLELRQAHFAQEK